MLLVDSRERDDIMKRLSPYDIEVALTQLDYGDFCWEGSGPHGPALIGVERKRLTDLISSMTDRRLSGHQLRGMYKTYDHVYLLVEGMWRPTQSGAIEHFHGGGWNPLFFKGSGVNYRQVDSYLSSLAVLGHIEVCRTSFNSESAAWLVSRYNWWQKPWGDHHSHDQIYTGGPERGKGKGVRANVSTEPGPVELAANTFPGLDRRAWECGRYFKSVQAMVNATQQEWRECLGIKEGVVVIDKVMKWVRGIRQ